MSATMPRDFPRPGRRSSDAARAAMLRVDQAGEFGATRIYAGQLAVMGDRHPDARLIAGMAAQEERHRRTFDAMIARRGVRPTALTPIWSVAGFALGAVTAAIGPRAAMACTAAIETEIDRHYSEQLKELGQDDPELSTLIADFQAEEVEHRDTALAHGAEQAPAYPLLSGAIRLGCRAAIALSKRI
ncbi:demethoxyubiquinone hydroxylase family protein [Sphingobium sp. CFD-1]|uniref:demethoxyubiquinone hydroxylase family protein n=1 Tax=Sphingobium sp. CFD-1 TaxID=2878545 RepID=UPI00214C5830|nr:demethoxyubiquinone hydroxylase family protein [Sphingobium sp. CFD-1]